MTTGRSLKTLDAQTRSVAAALKTAFRGYFGDRLADLYLFGSRARGDHAFDSDLDVAVVLRDPIDSLSSIDRELLDVTYPVEIDSGIHIQAWALPTETLDGRIDRYRARLAATIRAEGLRV